MGWYAGQTGAKRMRLRNYLKDAFGRFNSHLTSTSSSNTRATMTTVDFTDTILDNDDTSTMNIILHNPATHQEIIDEINRKGESTSDGPMVIAIPFNWHLKKLDDISDNICQRLEGLFLFGTVNICKTSLLSFIKRCPNLKALTIRSFGDKNYDHETNSFTQKLFTSGSAPNLEFFEGYIAADSTLASMASSPNLQVIVFSEPHNRVSNDGFRALVKTGGGKHLHRIQAGTLAKDRSKTLCIMSLSSILRDRTKCPSRTNLILSHMPHTLRPLPQDSEPYAVVPIERMNVKQLRAAIEKRGMPIPKPAQKDNFVKVLENAGFNLQEEAAIQAEAHIKQLKLTKPSGYKTKVAKLQKVYDGYHTKSNKRKVERIASENEKKSVGSNKEQKVD